MLANIRSSIILKKILNNVDDGIKLKIIHYNKRLQNKINISLFNYKLYSGRYIISEENGKIKEYYSYNNKLIYEGEYSRGKRNGIGKEYNDNSKLIYEGEYFNGKKNGIDKEYYENKIIFEGEYLYGKRKKGKRFIEKSIRI